MTMGSPIKVLGAGGAEVSEADSMARAVKSAPVKGAAEAKSTVAKAEAPEKVAHKEHAKKAEHKTATHEKSEK